MGLVVVAPGDIGLPGEVNLPVGGCSGQPDGGGRIGNIDFGELAGGGVSGVELELIPVGIGIGGQCGGGAAPVDE